jgi:hypothetical protein
VFSTALKASSTHKETGELAESRVLLVLSFNSIALAGKPLNIPVTAARQIREDKVFAFFTVAGDL